MDEDLIMLNRSDTIFKNLTIIFKKYVHFEQKAQKDDEQTHIILVQQSETSYSLMRRMNTKIESDGKRHGCTV